MVQNLSLYLCFGIDQDPLDYQWLIQKKNQLVEKVKLEGYENIKDVELFDRSYMTFPNNKEPEVITKDVLVTTGINVESIRNYQELILITCYVIVLSVKPICTMVLRRLELV